MFGFDRFAMRSRPRALVSAGAPAVPPLFDASDLTLSGTADHREVITSVTPPAARAARTGGGTNGRFYIDLSGNYRVDFGLSAYDGNINPITAVELNITEDFVVVPEIPESITAPGNYSFTRAFDGRLWFRINTNGRGFRLDNFGIYAA